jgi:hypothetical protein
MASWIAPYALVLAVSGWGAYQFALRDPRASSWMKIGFAVFFLLAFGGIGLYLHYVTFDESRLAFVLLALNGIGMVVGIPICLGAILGIVVGMYRKQSIDT